MKCIRCNNDAEFIFEGNSLCNSHFQQVGDNGTYYQNLFESLMELYTGNKSTIYKFLNEIKKTTFITKKHEYMFVKKIMEMADKYPVYAINNAIHIAIRNGKLKLNYIYKIVSNTAEVKQEENNDFTNNDAYAKMIQEKAKRRTDV